MKKLFTLLAAALLSANVFAAEEIADLLEFKTYEIPGAWGGSWSGATLEKEQDWSNYDYIWVKYSGLVGSINFGVTYSEFVADHGSWVEFKGATVPFNVDENIVGIKLDKTSVYEKGNAAENGAYVGDIYAKHIREIFVQATSDKSSVKIEDIWVGKEDEFKKATAAEYEIDKTFTSIAQLKDQPIIILNAEGKVFCNPDNQNLNFRDLNNLSGVQARYWLLESLADNADENVKNSYRLRSIHANKSNVSYWGWVNESFLNTQPAGDGDGCCFVLLFGDNMGQDVKYGAVWDVEYVAGKGFTLKSKALDGYFTSWNHRADAAEPAYFTFCTIKQKEEKTGGVDPTISDDDPAIVANKAALLTALNKAKALDLTLYMPAGAQKLAEAIEAGEALLKAKGGVVAELENARRAILQAIDELVAKAAKAEVAEKEVPEGWENMITNGNFATDDVASFFMVEPGKGLVPAAIEDGVDQGDWHAAVVRSQDNPSQDWDTQFFIRANTPLPVGTKIHVEFDYRSDVEGGADTQSHSEPTKYIHWACVGSPTFKEKWQHWEADVTVDNNMSDNFQTIAFNLAKNKKATTFYFDNIVFWAQKPAPAPEDEFQDIIKNGNMEGSGVSNFISKSYPSTDMVPSTIVAGAGKDGSKGIVIESPAKVSQDWDSQFWIVLPYTVPAGTTIKLQFDYKASAASSVSTQAHEAPGNYIHWACCGNVDFTTEWQTFDKQFSVPAECDGTVADGGYNKNFKSIAFNLTKDADITYYIDNVKLFLNKDVIATGVETVKPAVISNEAIFDLQGRRVAQPAKGLYIKNGKKVLIK